MPEENLGSGIYLDQDLDFGVNTNGDLRTVSGSEELQKDLAFQLLIILDDYIGPPLEPGVASEIRSKTIDTISSDTRVQSIDKGSLQVRQPSRNSIQIQASVEALGTEQTLVFNL